MEESIRQALTTLCLRNRFSYGVFWRFHPRNSMLLNREDAYVEETFQAVIDDMLLQVQMLGEGAVGNSALDGKHRWAYSHSPTRTGCCNVIPHSQDNSDLSSRFCAGIQTVAVVPVGSCGVLEFGSTHEIPETQIFLNQVRQVIGDQIGTITGSGSSQNVTSLLHDEDTINRGGDGLLDSVISSYTCLYSNNPTVLDGDHMSTDIHQQDLKSDPFHSSRADALDVGFNNNDKYRPATTLIDKQGIGNSLTADKPSNSDGFDGFDPNDILLWLDSYYHSSACPPLGEFNITTDDNLFQTMGSIDASCSELDGIYAPHRYPCNNGPAVSSQSCVTTALKPTTLQTQTPSSSCLPCVKNSLLGVDQKCVKSEQVMEEASLSGKEDIKVGKDSAAATLLQSISEVMKDGGGGASPTRPRSLFSELGLAQLLSSSNNGGACSSSLATSGSEDHQFSDANKRRKLESSFSCSVGNKSHRWNFPPKTCESQDDDLGFNSVKKCFPNSQVGLWVSESYNSNDKSCITTSQHQEPSSKKGTKKRTKPRESSRPRPKDRQMIQDRLKELRDMIPNCSKCSIDLLLCRTIKHMVFLQGMTNFVDKLKQVNEYKAGRAEFSNNGTGKSNSAAWAVEVDGQNPIIVEDIGHSGLMLIEMLCEEQGLFLEIADVIRGFGLTILKGVIEAREDKKIWAHFIVEAYGQVSRMEVLMRLLQLFQEAITTTSSGNTKVKAPATMMMKKFELNSKAINHMSLSSSSSSSSPIPSPSQLKEFHQPPLISTAMTFGLGEMLR